ncbi:hypothetical protein HPP92_015547 [Vanilla planifolia]|uniref:Uncharacterized protein n=1 Tax=Vanilla planifolia TaxID=51239 RepID=A0A835QI41_VANPL|nr:hypothetical protein HPP92_015547 [Vanilla planifolia]
MEHGSDGDRSGFHGNEVISAVQDEEQFYGEDEDYDDLLQRRQRWRGILPVFCSPW